MFRLSSKISVHTARNRAPSAKFAVANLDIWIGRRRFWWWPRPQTSAWPPHQPNPRTHAYKYVLALVSDPPSACNRTPSPHLGRSHVPPSSDLSPLRPSLPLGPFHPSADHLRGSAIRSLDLRPHALPVGPIVVAHRHHARGAARNLHDIFIPRSRRQTPHPWRAPSPRSTSSRGPTRLTTPFAPIVASPGHLFALACAPAAQG